MGTEDWYRNETWNSEIEEAFEARLKRSRGAYYKAQYMRIQASYLLSSKKSDIQNIGVILMKRMINDFPTETSSTIFGHEQLGDYYFSKSDYENAIYYYDIVNDFYEKGKRNGTSGIADLKLIDIILKGNRKNQYKKAYNICKNYQVENISLNSDKYYYYELFALLCDKLKKQDEAKQYAMKALEMAEITEPQFRYHKNVGLVNASNEQLIILKQIVNG
jgi:hypothetical protein